LFSDTTCLTELVQPLTIQCKFAEYSEAKQAFFLATDAEATSLEIPKPSCKFKTSARKQH
jgi:hypothetical protein